MKTIRTWSFLLIIFAMPAFGYVEKTTFKSGVEVDYADPVSVVTAAKDLLFKVDYYSMLEITESGEKKKTQKTIDSIKEDTSLLKDLKEEAHKIEKFMVLGQDIFEEKGVAVVYTRWHIKRTIESAKGMKIIEDPSVKPYSVVYVDYLLKNYDGKWKIISQKSK